MPDLEGRAMLHPTPQLSPNRRVEILERRATELRGRTQAVEDELRRERQALDHESAADALANRLIGGPSIAEIPVRDGRPRKVPVTVRVPV